MNRWPASGRRDLSLALLSGLLLGLSFPPVPTGILAGVALVPFFLLLEEGGYAKAFRLSYVTFFVLNLITLYWTGGFTHGKDPYLMAAGALLILAHPFFFFPPVAAWLFIRKGFGAAYALCMFPFLWVAFEYLHSLADISFPWLTLGNTQTYDLPAVQMASITGVYGVSFWLVWLNVLAYFFTGGLRSGARKLRSPRSALLAAAVLLVFLLPRIYGMIVLGAGTEPSGNPIRIGIVQPNIDPFEKWEKRPEDQLRMLEQLTGDIASKKADLILWPETAIPFYLLDPRHRDYFESMKRRVDSLGIPLLTGIPDITYYRAGDPIPRSSKTLPGGSRYDNYNSSILLQPHDEEIQKYAKMLLVPFAERVPFSEALSFLNAMQWNFGLGGWAVGKEKTVFRVRGGADSAAGFSFSNFICYESVYPGFVADFVRGGAEFLTVITNDSWWGNTSGAYQHAQFAVLRAVENRRWVVQCANGGISCAVDPYGHQFNRTEMFSMQSLVTAITPARDLTFYSRMGDWFAESCLVLSLFHLAAALGSRIYTRIRGK